MRILICDDDVLMIEQLKKLITSYFQERHINCPELSCFSDGESLLADTKEKDILFLDVEMPGMNGIYIGNELKNTIKISLSLLLHLILNIWMMPCVFMSFATYPNP